MVKIARTCQRARSSALPACWRVVGQLFALTATLIARTASAQHPVVVEPPLSQGTLKSMSVAFEPFVPAPGGVDESNESPSWEFTDVDRARYGFDELKVWLEQNPIACGDGLDPAKSAIRVTLARTSATGTTYWSVSEPPIFDAPGWCSPESWVLMDRENEEPPDVVMAADETTPILSLSYRAEWDRLYVTQHLVLDARATPPRIVGRLEAVWDDHTDFNRPDPPNTTCAWHPARGDFLCAETLQRVARYSWLSTGELVARPPGSAAPPDVGSWLNPIVNTPPALGAWAAPADIGAVRLIARVPTSVPGRSIHLLGADDLLGAPYFVAITESGHTRVTPVTISTAEIRADPEHGIAPSYRLVAEPPRFFVRALVSEPGGLQLFSVVAERSIGMRGDYYVRRVSHVAIESSEAGVVAHAVAVASSTTRNDSRAELYVNNSMGSGTEFGGFARPVRIRRAPLRIDYDVEPEYTLIRDEPPYRETERCATRAQATWTRGSGFVVDHRWAPCPVHRFRSAYVRRDGLVETYQRIFPDGPP